jgi:perosamine synthetase
MRDIPQMMPDFNALEAEALSKYMQGGGFITEFKVTLDLEKVIAEFIQSKHVIMVPNGTISLSMMLMVLGIGSGDEVIVPNYTMIATPNAVISVGATPVFVDVEKQTLCIDIEKIQEKISERTKAIIFVSANGRYPAAGIERIQELCKENSIFLLEDSAQALGSLFPDGSHIGTKGIMGSFSFSTPKIISTGQGGCIVTDSDELNGKLRELKDFGRSKSGIDIHDSIGFNFKFTDLQATIGLVQMEKIEFRQKRKKEIWALYYEMLADVKEIELFPHQIQFTCPWFVDSVAQNRDSLKQNLADLGIGTRVMYPPINAQKAYSQIGSFPISEYIGKHGLWLPSFVQISNEQIEDVCNAIREFYL